MNKGKTIDDFRCLHQVKKDNDCNGCVYDPSNKICPTYHQIHYVKYIGTYIPKEPKPRN
ncbi:hypothetical protein M0R04_09865 [Candidatus Dojkabacteria bacterium]|jgi:hypothetical protein|nr:hypothetical protein [Candidatus Dojkabacteria bacterium]